ncbi:MAG: tRNA pseudouridine(13) synthase TruD [Anaerolineae bacterium]|nr:tRNA pseudouridine(13) synthase TruD [Anaerolineae bacterium]
MNRDLDDISDLPFITGDLPGIGGQIKAEPAHFVVEEIPLYDASGEGQHVYVHLTREGWATRELQERLADLFGIRHSDVGCAGWKDKHAHVTQTFSLDLPTADAGDVARRIAAELPVQVEWARRHRNKLKTGHLIGNRFHIVVLDPHPQALARSEAIAAALRERGLPNFYGVQRFGMHGDNAQKGRAALLTGRGPRQRWLHQLVLRAYQSALFNMWLAARIERGWFRQLLAGDVAKKTDTGGMFEVEDAAVEQPRFERGEIDFTGPIYGHRMTWAGGAPGALEREILEHAGVTEPMLRQAHLTGSRRRGRLLVDDLTIESHPQGVLLAFSLPKGSYATTLLREMMKSEIDLGDETDA